LPTTRELRRLFEAIAKQSWSSAQTIAEGIATSEAERGNTSASRTLTDALRSVKTSAAIPTSTLDLGLARGRREDRLADVVLPDKLRANILEIVDEFRHSDELERLRLPVRRRLLLVGPPGCGKSLTAQALANELSLPFFIVRFDSLIGAYLGQTAVNLRQLFRFAEGTPGVLLFDEIDAIGRRRGRSSDVGELDRIVIALMQELELACPKGLIVATSNVPEHLDEALVRRFDAKFLYPSPTPQALRSFSQRLAKRFAMRLTPSVIKAAEKAMSYADAEAITINYLRRERLLELKADNG
jgi:SpoVK/Ycf46/Vps4 family AAA+-type ATPase